jgi:hypothetical protein
MYPSAPNFIASALFESDDDIAIVVAPSAFENKTPRCPRPPIPTIPTVFPGPAPQRASGAYTVAPPQRRGAACWELRPSGIGMT